MNKCVGWSACALREYGQNTDGNAAVKARCGVGGNSDGGPNDYPSPQVQSIFESILIWGNFSVRVKESDIEKLPEVHTACLVHMAP